MQAEQVAGLQHHRPDLVIPAHGEVELIIQRLLPARPSIATASRCPFTSMRGGRETIAPRGSMSSTSTQATGSPPWLLDRDH